MFGCVKGIGIMLVMSVSVIMGFYFSSQTIIKNEKTRLIYRGINSLAERLRISSMKSKKLLKISFSEEVLYWKNEEYFIDKSNLSSEDISLFEEFLKGFGKGDTKSEYLRALGYAKLFENRYKELKEKSGPLCSLYRKLGVLTGLFICVFLV